MKIMSKNAVAGLALAAASVIGGGALIQHQTQKAEQAKMEAEIDAQMDAEVDSIMIARGLDLKDSYARSFIKVEASCKRLDKTLSNLIFQDECHSRNLDPKLERSKEDLKKIIDLEKQIEEIKMENNDEFSNDSWSKIYSLNRSARLLEKISKNETPVTE